MHGKAFFGRCSQCVNNEHQFLSVIIIVVFVVVVVASVTDVKTTQSGFCLSDD
jgi:hypothetical protein